MPAMTKKFVIFDRAREDAIIDPISSWDPYIAYAVYASYVSKGMTDIYRFKFITRHREDDDLDSKITETSCWYFVGGSLFTQANTSEKQAEIFLSSHFVLEDENTRIHRSGNGRYFLSHMGAEDIWLP